MKAFVDKDACIGCGLCTALCSEVFTMDEDGKALASSKELDEILEQGAKEAETQCPVAAIRTE